MFLLVFALAVQAPISAAAMSWDDLDWGDAATTEEAGGAGTEDSGNELNWDAPTTGFDIPGEEEAEDAAQEEPPLNFYEPMFGSTAATPFTEAPVKESPALVSEAPMMAGEGDSPLENFQGYGNSKVKMNSRDDVVQVPKDPEGFSYDNPVLLDITDDTIIELHDKEDGKDVCWVRNVGTYGGKAIDLKVTGLRDGEGIIEVSTRLFKEDGSTSNIELIRETNRNTYKTAGLPAAYPTKESEKGTLRGIWFAPGKNSFLLFEIYCDGALTPLTMALTLDDIDDSQTYTIYPLDGKVSKIYAREDTVVSMEVGTGSAVSGAPSLVTDRGYVKYYGGWNWPAYDPRFAATMDFVGMSSFVIYTTGSNIHEFAINSNDLLGGGIPTFEPPTATKHIYDSAGNLMDGKVLTAGQEYTYQITSDQPYLDAMTVVIEDELPAEVELVDFSLEETLYEDSTDVYQQGNKLKWVIYGVENTPDGEVVSVSVKVKAKNTAAVLVNKAQSFLFMPDDNPEEDGAIEESEESVVTNYIIIPVKNLRPLQVFRPLLGGDGFFDPARPQQRIECQMVGSIKIRD